MPDVVDDLDPGGMALPQQLVELDAGQEDDRRDEQVARQHEQGGQAADRRLEVGDVGDPEPEQERGDDPGGYDENGAEARPARPRALRRGEPDEEADEQTEEDDRAE